MQYTYGSVYPFTATFRHADGAMVASVSDPSVHLIAPDASTLDVAMTELETGKYALDWTVPDQWPLGVTRYCYRGTFDGGTWSSDEESFTVSAVAGIVTPGLTEDDVRAMRLFDLTSNYLMDIYASQVVTITRRSGTYDVHGQPATERPVDIAGRLQQTTKMVRSKTGEQLLSDAQVFLLAGTVIAPGDKIEYSGAEFEVLAVKRGQGFNHETHVVAYLGGR